MKGQTEEAISTVSEQLKQKTILQNLNHNEKAESYVPDEGTN